VLGGKDRFLMRSVLFSRASAGRSRWTLFGGLGWALGACSSPPTLAGVGGRCMQVADCQLGLVCVYQSNGAGTCSSDTSSLVMTEEGGSAATGTTMPPPSGDAGVSLATGTDDAGTSDEPPGD
jgi:hypothetical protein